MMMKGNRRGEMSRGELEGGEGDLEADQYPI